MGKHQIRRIRISLRPGRVSVRGQAASPRGTPFTVGSSVVKLTDGSKDELKAAVKQAVQDVYPDTSELS